jgi:hypothetical protein
VQTARGLAIALAWNDGIQNTAVQLIALDKVAQTQAQESIAVAEKEAKLLYFIRENDILYEGTKMSGGGKHMITIYHHSNIGPGAQFIVDLTPDQYLRKPLSG